MLNDRNSKISRKENCRSYRVKRKLHERDQLFSIELDNINIIKIHTKFKTDKHQYQDNLHLFCVRNELVINENNSLQNNINYNSTIEENKKNKNMNSNNVVDMELERNLVERHYSSQNSYLNGMMFDK